MPLIASLRAKSYINIVLRWSFRRCFQVRQGSGIVYGTRNTFTIKFRLHRKVEWCQISTYLWL